MNNKLKTLTTLSLFLIYLFSTQKTLFSFSENSVIGYENIRETNSIDIKEKPKVPLTINVLNLETSTGTIVIGVYGAKNKFLDEKDKIKEYRLKPKNGIFSIQLSDLSYGEIALAVFQDVDEDGEMDKNMLGIPQEPYAFSRNYKPRFHAPSFQDCKVKYSHNSHILEMTLIR